MIMKIDSECIQSIVNNTGAEKIIKKNTRYMQCTETICESILYDHKNLFEANRCIIHIKVNLIETVAKITVNDVSLIK